MHDGKIKACICYIFYFQKRIGRLRRGWIVEGTYTVAYVSDSEASGPCVTSCTTIYKILI